MTLKQFVIAHWPWFMLFVGYPMITSVLNWYLWWDTEEHWEAFKKAHPKWAFFVKVMRAVGPHFRKVVVAWRDYTARRSFNPPAPPADQTSSSP